MLLLFVAPLRCATACGSKELIFTFGTVRLKSYPVTCGWPAKKWLRGQFIVAFCRFAPMLLLFCRFAMLLLFFVASLPLRLRSGFRPAASS
jgi:hypothetical protein